MKLGLYSITYLGLWYNGGALTLEQVIDRARKFGYQGVEIDGKRPHANPLDMSPERCRQVRRCAEDQGIEIYAVAANNDFSSPIPEHREAQLVYLRELIRMTAELGVALLRVFCAWSGVTEGPDCGSYELSRRLWRMTHQHILEEQRWEWCRQGLVESARFAAEHGVTLALQNHTPVINEDRDLLRMVEEIGSLHLKLCLDAPLMKQKDEAYIRQIAHQVGPLQVLSHFGGEYERGADGLVRGEEYYLPFAKAMREIGYEGYIGYELCHPLPKVDGVTVGIDFVDKNAELAAEFMRGVLAEAERQTEALSRA
jgi:sugar phosphate isomerase/epimerase